MEFESIKKKLGETRYPDGKIVAVTVGLAPIHEQHIQEQVARLNYQNPSAGWNRSSYIQWLLDKDIRRVQKEEERIPNLLRTTGTYP